MNQYVAVQLNRRFPLFPLPETMLLPHAIMPITVYEPRYRQMTDHALDGSGQIAIATYCGGRLKDEIDCPVPLRDVVCLGQIVQHEKARHGYNILVYGLCRAEIQEEFEPQDDLQYRTVKLRPMENNNDEVDEEYRDELRKILDRPNMQRLQQLDTVVQWINEPEVSTPELFELVGCSLFTADELLYSRLAEQSV